MRFPRLKQKLSRLNPRKLGLEIYRFKRLKTNNQKRASCRSRLEKERALGSKQDQRSHPSRNKGKLLQSRNQCKMLQQSLQASSLKLFLQ